MSITIKTVRLHKLILNSRYGPIKFVQECDRPFVPTPYNKLCDLHIPDAIDSVAKSIHASWHSIVDAENNE
jgi:hypothetical protein